MEFLIHPAVENLVFLEILLFVGINAMWILIYHRFKARRNVFKQGYEPAVSIVIPAYNKGGLLRKTISAVMNIDYPRKEIIVVNDGSTDRTHEMCSKLARAGKIRYVKQRRMGKATALNTGVRIASHDIIVTVDADSLPEKDSIRKMMGYFADPKVGAVAGHMYVAPVKKFIVPFQKLEYIFMNFQRMCQGFLSAILVCPGPLSAFRKDAIVKSGYFSHDTLVEDFDMTVSVQRAGYKVAYAKKAKVATYTPTTLDGLWTQRLRWGRGAIQIAKKHYPVLWNRDTRMLGMFSFPLHIMWVTLPVVLMGTMLIYVVPNVILSLYETVLAFKLLLPITNVATLYAFVQNMVINIFSLNKVTTLLLAGYASVMIYMGLMFTSYKSVDRRFRPRDLRTILFISLYWLMLTAVFAYAMGAEIVSKRRKW